MLIDGPSRELWFTAPREIELRVGPKPVLESGQVLARALASGVSRGTELLLYRGEGPTPFDPSLDRPGQATYPRRYGYSWVGEVIETRADELPVGTRIFCLAPHGDVHVSDAARARPIPRKIPPRRAALAASLETAVTCAWDTGASLGDSVVVLGAGVVGLLATWLIARSGARVHVVEPVERRRSLALELGARSACHPNDDRPAASADVVVEASGNPALLARALEHAAREARVVALSFYGRRAAPLELGSDFHRRRVTLKSSQVSQIPPERAPRWSQGRRFDLVLDLLEDARLDALIDDPVPFDRAPDVYARFEREPERGIQTVFVYREE